MRIRAFTWQTQEHASFINSFVRVFVCSFTPSFIHPSVRSLPYLRTRKNHSRSPCPPGLKSKKWPQKGSFRGSTEKSPEMPQKIRKYPKLDCYRGTKSNEHEQLFGIVLEMGGGQICLCVAFCFAKKGTHMNTCPRTSQENDGEIKTGKVVVGRYPVTGFLDIEVLRSVLRETHAKKLSNFPDIFHRN